MPPHASRDRGIPAERRNDARQGGLALADIPGADNEDGSREGEGEDARPRHDDTDLESVYRNHGARVSRWAARLAGPGFDIEDIVHDVFLVVQRRLKEFRGDARISTWLYEITVRVVQARRLRKRRREWSWPFSRGPESRGTGALDIAGDDVSPLDALETRQATALLYSFLDELDEKYRTAVILFEIDEVPCQDIAIITGTSISNVWARVSRGREKLIQAFAKWEARKQT